MAMRRKTQRILGLSVLWGVVLLTTALSAAQVFTILMAPTGYWQWPKVAHVVVGRVEKDPVNAFTDLVLVTHGEEQKALRMWKREHATLRPGDSVWVLYSYFASSLRPAHYRLTPQRLVFEYPFPLLILSLWGIWRIVRQGLGRAEDEEDLRDPDRPREVLRDEFHRRVEKRV